MISGNLSPLIKQTCQLSCWMTCSSAACSPVTPLHESNPTLSMSTSTHPSNQISNQMTFLWKAPRQRKGAKRRRAPRKRRRVRPQTAQRKGRSKQKWTSCWWVCRSHSDKNKAARSNVTLDVFVDVCRCTTRSWRVSMATLKTGFTLSTCTEERPGMTTNTLWMTTGLSADLRWENTSASQPTLADSCTVKIHLFINLLLFFCNPGILMYVQATSLWGDHEGGRIRSKHGNVPEHST